MIQEMRRSADGILALAAGMLLALMIRQNSALAKDTTPLFASWMAHGIGAIASLGLVLAAAPNKEHRKAPAWAYLGGVPGALTVVLAAITVNSRLALSGTLALSLVGQVLWGLFLDHFGLLGVPRRRLMLQDLWVVLSVSAGSGLLIFSRI